MVAENATLGTVIGSFAARDEDRRQKLSFSLVNDDGGRFALNGDQLVTATSLDHEADKRHFITVAVVDNGYNALKVIFKILMQQSVPSLWLDCKKNIDCKTLKN